MLEMALRDRASSTEGSLMGASPDLSLNIGLPCGNKSHSRSSSQESKSSNEQVLRFELQRVRQAGSVADQRARSQSESSSNSSEGTTTVLRRMSMLRRKDVRNEERSSCTAVGGDLPGWAPTAFLSVTNSKTCSSAEDQKQEMLKLFDNDGRRLQSAYSNTNPSLATSTSFGSQLLQGQLAESTQLSAGIPNLLRTLNVSAPAKEINSVSTWRIGGAVEPVVGGREGDDQEASWKQQLARLFGEGAAGAGSNGKETEIRPGGVIREGESAESLVRKLREDDSIRAAGHGHGQQVPTSASAGSGMNTSGSPPRNVGQGMIKQPISSSHAEAALRSTVQGKLSTCKRSMRAPRMRWTKAENGRLPLALVMKTKIKAGLHY